MIQKPVEAMEPEHWCQQLTAAAAQVGVVLLPEMAEGMHRHAELLIEWNRRINLTAITRPGDILVKHMVDSIAAVPYIPDGARMLDIGSGGGFPGLPLAVVLPSLAVTLIDASRKKVSFISHVIRSIPLERASAFHERAEHMARQPGHCGRYDVVVCRALTSLDRFISLARPFLGDSGRIIAYRGQAEEDAMAGIDISTEGFRRQEIAFSLPGIEAQRRLVLLDLD